MSFLVEAENASLRLAAVVDDEEEDDFEGEKRALSLLRTSSSVAK